MIKRVLLFLAIIALIGMSSCRSKQVAVQGNEVELVFSDKRYRSDRDYFRAHASGTSTDLQFAKQMAEANARTELAQSISTIIKAVTENYGIQSSTDGVGYDGRFEAMSRTATKQSLLGSVLVDEKAFKYGKEFTYHCVVEVSRAAVEEEFARASENTLNRDRFRRIFEEEMEKLENK
jgi:hypothetical protein